MTAQIPDIVKYRSDAYSLAGANGDGLFSPDAVGMDVKAMSTGCWRGFICDYEIVDRTLVLVAVEVALSDATLSRGPAPALFGVEPGPARRGFGNDSVIGYSRFREPVGFTGTLLLGRGFVSEYYVHMGFQDGWKYATVHELTFERGRLVAELDRSAAAAEARARRRPNRYPAPRDPEGQRQWIAASLRLAYEPFE